MTKETIGCAFCNLIVPDEPNKFEIKTANGIWEFERDAKYVDAKAAISVGKCAITYLVFRKVDIGSSRSAAMDTAVDEMLAVSLGASYLIGLTAAPAKDLPMSAVKFLAYGDHYPRPRAMGEGTQMTTSLEDFVKNLEIFVSAYPSLERSEKARLLIHHWLDGVAFWSLEDLTLSTSTILEVIAATAETVSAASGNKLQYFVPRLDFAARRYGLPPLPADFRNMRNDLVHQGRLSGTKFQNKDKIDCAQAISEALAWIDMYICAAFGLKVPASPRFRTHDLVNANAFSLE